MESGAVGEWDGMTFDRCGWFLLARSMFRTGDWVGRGRLCLCCVAFLASNSHGRALACAVRTDLRCCLQRAGKEVHLMSEHCHATQHPRRENGKAPYYLKFAREHEARDRAPALAKIR